jgi:uncharacterized membrane protein (DUF4010 family)
MNELFNTTNGIDPTLASFWYKISISLLIGLLIGVERESRKKIGAHSFAGIRTFPMVSLFGFLSALIASITEMYVYVSMFLIFGLLISISYYFSAKEGRPGGTTEISTILVFILGSLVFWDYLLLSVAISVVMLIFLTLKSEFRAFAGKIEQEDFFAAIKFAIITVIVLPLLPDRTYLLLDVFNPRKIWYMVVLIAGISFIGYVLFKLIGSKKGIQILSILGGLASSTALTLSFTSRSKEVEALSRNFAAGIILASTIMFPRVLLIIFVLNTELGNELILPVVIFTITGIATSYWLWRKDALTEINEVKLTNPFKLLFAIKFGLLFAVILFISKAAQVYLGNQGTYFMSFFSGLADVDAISLSITELVGNTLSIKVAVYSILLAFLANTIVKGFISTMFGSKELRKYALRGFGVMIAVTLVYVGVSLI